MSTAVLDEREQRRAQVRAQAASIADAPRAPRRFAVTPGVRLRPTSRQRQHNRRRAPTVVVRRRSRSLRRFIAAAVLLLQVALLMLALNLPMFKVRSVSVTGTTLLTRDSVLQAAAVPNDSIFTIDGNAIRSRVLSLPWVASVAVSTELPAAVRISVVERSPALRIRRNGSEALVADNGASISGAVTRQPQWSGLPVLLDDRIGSMLPVSPSLLQVMDITAQRFRAVLGCSVAAYQWDGSNVFAIWASTGWRAVLGHLDTADAVAAVPAQLAALGALTGQLGFQHPSFGYVDLENPSAPAVGGKPGLPAEILAARAPLSSEPVAPPAAASATLPPTPTPVPSPTPIPSPTPLAFSIVPPSPKPVQ